MPGDDVKFEEQLAALGGYVPAEEAARKALEAARQAVLEARAARQKKRRLWMKLTIPSGIAAALVGAAVLVMAVPGAHTVNAAEQLQAAVEATTAYKGWVHWTYADPTAATKPGISNQGVPKLTVRHFNADLGIRATRSEYDNNKVIADIVWTTRHEEASYDSTTGEVRIATLTDEVAGQFRRTMAPMTVAEMVTQIKKRLGRDPLSVTETPEGEATRFNVVLFNSEVEAAAFAKTQGVDGFPKGFTVWVNKDKLVTRYHMDVPPGAERGFGVIEATVTYGPPEIKDIYDLGVPRNTKVVDQRVGGLSPQEEDGTLAKVNARLEERRQKGFGDGVALLSSNYMDSTGRNIETRSGNVTLFINQGDKWVANQYVLFMPANVPAGLAHPVLKEAPEGWPAPEMGKLLPALKAASPQVSLIMNGDQGWIGSLSMDGKLHLMTATREHDGKQLDMQTLAGQLWPRKEQLGIGYGNVDSSLQRYNILRLRHKGETTSRDTGEGVFEMTYMLDLGKDDLPTEWYRNVVRKDATVLSERTSVHYTAFDRLPDGQWYPTDWTETRVQRDPETGNDNGSVQRYHLQIMQGMKLEDSWFEAPAGAVIRPAPGAR
jgi:hypothetical protein